MKLSFPIFILSLIAISLPQIVWAQTEWQYSPLTNLPFIGDGGQDIGAYINALYLMAISVAAFLAVLRIIFGGVQYMLTDVVTTKEEAKKTIRGAIIGLLIVIAAVLVLETINPNLTDLDVINVDPNDRIPYLPTGTYDGLGDGPGTPDHVCTTNPSGCSNQTCPTGITNCAGWCDARGGVYDAADGCTYPTPSDGLDTYNIVGVPSDVIDEIEAACEAGGGRFITYLSGIAKCLGNVSDESDDNVVNTQAVLEDYLNANPGLSPEIVTLVSQQYNQFVANEEPDDVDLDQIRIDLDLPDEEILFVVNRYQAPDPKVAYDSQYEALCDRFTGGEGGLVGDPTVGYWVCAR